MKMKWMRLLIAGAMGITTQRPFPVLARRKPGPHPAGQTDKRVIFLSDVFSRFLEPDVEQSAFDLLAAGGYEVKILPVIGAGAALLSKGFVGAARRHAEKILAEIRRLDDGLGLCIVGCEPPEIYCLKHEYASLLPARQAEIDSVTQRTWLIEEFLLREQAVEKLRVVTYEDQTNPPIQTPRERMYFHPHCHQQAESLADDGFPSGTPATIEFLRRLGVDIEIIDSGCCGMAGTFGYDAEHYELSMQVGELSLLPKVRMMKNILSSGSACRMQIRHGSGVEALHPVVLARNILLKPAEKGN